MTPSELKLAAGYIDQSLHEVCGLSEKDRKIITCWIVGTHALKDVSIFPMMVLRGPMGTGKSSAQLVIDNFSRNSKRFSLSGTRAPSVRDFLADAYNATACIEESDGAWGDKENLIEKLFNARWSRSTDDVNYKIQSATQKGDPSGNWKTESKKIFGATCLHCREKFRDPALDGKSITILFRHNAVRDTNSYRAFNASDPWNVEGKRLLSNADIRLPEVKHPAKVAGRIFDNWKVILQVATLLCDQPFCQELTDLMMRETAKLNRSQGDEPLAVVCRAIISHVFPDPDWRTAIQIQTNNVCKRLFDEYQTAMSSYAVAEYAREMGLVVSRRGGRSQIFVDKLSMISAAEFACVHDDEDIRDLKTEIYGNCASVERGEKD